MPMPMAASGWGFQNLSHKKFQIPFSRYRFTIFERKNLRLWHHSPLVPQTPVDNGDCESLEPWRSLFNAGYVEG